MFPRRIFIAALIALLLGGLAGCERGDGQVPTAETDDSGYRAGQQFARQGRTQEALNAYLKVIAKRGDSAPESHLEAGIIYLQSIKDPLAAIYHFRKYLELQPNSRQAIYVKGLVDTAKREFARTLPASPLDSQAERLDNQEQIDRLQRENDQLRAELASSRAGTGLPTVTTRVTLGDTSGAPAQPAYVPPPVTAEESPLVMAPENSPTVTVAPLATPANDTNDRPELKRTKPTPPPANRTHVVKKGDTLFNISQRYYGTPSKWRAIYDANRDQLPSQNSLKLNMELKIP
ncbi:MAG: LysM peptidoglycan-binding domain-containing protein [Verrucomicrobia bacterium]|nr:LysM peptidoglycan-binding domain-containing protein [Verrucomicrobiota bacterium]